MAAFSALLLLASLPPLPPATGGSDDWPRWRGPLSTGAAPDANPPVHWGPDENIKWKAALPGHGKSTPIVMGERIYLLAAEPTRKATAEELAARTVVEGGRGSPPDEWLRFWVLALDRGDGHVVWQKAVTERLPVASTHQTNGYASSSPVTDGQGLYASFGSHGVYALDPKSGEVRWSFELGPQTMRGGFGEASSPALWEDTLVIAADQEGGSRLIALDTASGKVRWETPRDEASTWTTPLVLEAAGKTQVIVNGSGAVRSYDLSTGTELWRCSGQTTNAIPTPVSDGEILIATSGFRGTACYALALTGQGDLKQAEDAIFWTHEGGTPYVPSPVLVDRKVYFLSGNKGLLSCLDLGTGEVLIDRERLELTDIYASPMAAGGRLYVTDREGATVVLQHGEELEVLARNTLDEPVDATPVAVGKTLYLRSDSSLFAIEE
jgi:outer membrane protein assembly factor BamB